MKRFFLLTVILIIAAGGTGWCRVDSYHLGPRDILVVSIYAGGVEQESIEVTLSEQGVINVPFIGSIRAQGLTVSQLEAAVQAPLKKDYFVSPQVNIQVKEYRSLRFFISGAVKMPGKYEMSSNTNFLELLARSGGILAESGSIAYVLREGRSSSGIPEDIKAAVQTRETLKIDLARLLSEGDMTHNISLLPGDIVYVPPAKKLNQAGSKIYVEGEVKTPGVYDFQPGMTALAACLLAGGFGEWAVLSKSKIFRTINGKQEVIRVDLKQITIGKIADVSIRPGDRIHIPET